MIRQYQGGVRIPWHPWTRKDKWAPVEYSSQVSTALEGIVESINLLHNSIHKLETGTEEMSATTDEIAKDINRISVVTQETFSSSEEISQAAAGLSDLSRRLEGAVQSLRSTAVFFLVVELMTARN